MISFDSLIDAFDSFQRPAFTIQVWVALAVAHSFALYFSWVHQTLDAYPAGLLVIDGTIISFWFGRQFFDRKRDLQQ